ncbi:VanZ family protein [Vogesella sp. DC21W]|uniref:VanZ family protein n=1 Tax=Vogesella aquatica TaxID=2984206 RepID=A0ABT5IZB0_9NEIS|nr:VanZ family protein [Vogesella aquatica]MDC7717915.1 VanZ family protein [Vogesella aquatica]
MSRLIAYLPAALWWLASVYLLLLKPAGTPSGIPYFDKIGHFCLFALGALLLALPRAWRGQPLRQLMPAVLGLCLLWAVGSELGQALLTTTRSAEVMDAVADMAGALTGVMLAAHGIALWRARV